MAKSNFWLKKDITSMARSLRLAVVQNQFGQGNLSEQEARELLRGELAQGKPESFYDDSDCLKIEVAENEVI